MFRRTIGQNIFAWLYNDLLGLGMIIVDDHSGQCPKLIHALATLIMLDKHSSCLMMNFRYCHESLSGPGAEELLHFVIACLSSSLENGAQRVIDLWLILLRMSMLVC